MLRREPGVQIITDYMGNDIKRLPVSDLTKVTISIPKRYKHQNEFSIYSGDHCSNSYSYIKFGGRYFSFEVTEDNKIIFWSDDPDIAKNKNKILLYFSKQLTFPDDPNDYSGRLVAGGRPFNDNVTKDKSVSFFKLWLRAFNPFQSSKNKIVNRKAYVNTKLEKLTESGTEIDRHTLRKIYWIADIYPNLVAKKYMNYRWFSSTNKNRTDKESIVKTAGRVSKSVTTMSQQIQQAVAKDKFDR